MATGHGTVKDNAIRTFRLRTPFGAVAGVDFGDYVEFRGIRYAAAARWAAPEVLPFPKGEVSATTWGKKCWQYDWTDEEFYGHEFYDDDSYDVPKSEDCLNLNIFVPKAALSGGAARAEDSSTSSADGSTSKADVSASAPGGAESAADSGLPVAVWFHGGGNINGWNCEKEFDGAGYARRGVILVTANYRLGMFGFFCHPELLCRDGRAGNYAILDQLAAVKWVRENIGIFGGGRRVSVFGQSAGSADVQTILSSPLSRGLIDGAVMHSGLRFRDNRRALLTAGEWAEMAKDYFDGLGLSFDRLLAMEAEEVFALESDFMEYMSARNTGFGPVVDGVVLPDAYERIQENGGLTDVPVMLGCTLNDRSVSQRVEDDPDDNGAYRTNRLFAEALASQGRNAYLYYFTRQLPGDENGAFHACDLWYVFGTVRRAWRPLTGADEELSERMMDHWAAFFTAGSPDLPGDAWPAHSAEKPFVKRLDIAR